jgi:hypothetical protein
MQGEKHKPEGDFCSCIESRSPSPPMSPLGTGCQLTACKAVSTANGCGWEELRGAGWKNRADVPPNSLPSLSSRWSWMPITFSSVGSVLSVRMCLRVAARRGRRCDSANSAQHRSVKLQFNTLLVTNNGTLLPVIHYTSIHKHCITVWGRLWILVQSSSLVTLYFLKSLLYYWEYDYTSLTPKCTYRNRKECTACSCNVCQCMTVSDGDTLCSI